MSAILNTAVKAPKRPSDAISSNVALTVGEGDVRAVTGALEAEVRYARGNDKTDNAPVPMFAADFPSFAAAVLGNRSTCKGKGYIVAECGRAPDDPAHHNGSEASRRAVGGPHRCKACVLSRRFIVLDVDKGLTRERFAALVGILAGYSCVVWESASSTDAEPRCKAIIEVDVSASREALIAASAAVRGRIDAALVALGYDPMIWDTSADRPEQPCFTPTLGAKSYTFGGAAICLAEVLCDAPLPAESVVAAPLPAANDGSGLVVLDDRHGDLLKLAGRFAREVRFHGMAETSAIAAMMGEVERGRYSRVVPSDEIRRAFQGALAKIDCGAWPAPGPVLPEPAALSAPSLRAISVDNLSAAKLSPPRHVLDGLIPRRVVTLLGAHGGAGKTTLAIALGAHVAAGADWAGRKVEHGRVVFVSLEDEPDLMRYRLAHAIDAYGLDHAAVANNFVLIDGATSDASLADEQGNGRTLVETNALRELDALAEGAVLVIVDNASDGFDGNANDPRMVRTFVRRMLGKIARKHDLAVVLLAHIDKSGARNGTAGNSFIGTVSWHNSARSRLALLESNGRLELVHEKSNLGKKSEAIGLHFADHGVLMPLDGAQCAPDAGAAFVAASDADALLLAIRCAVEAGVSIPTGRAGPATAQAILSTLSDLPQTLRSGRGRARFWAALDLLRRSGRVSIESYQNEYRHQRTRWVPA